MAHYYHAYEPRNFKIHSLRQGQEFRMIVDAESRVRVWLISGECEIFGTELKQAIPKNRRHRPREPSPNDYSISDSYLFCDCSVAFFSSSKQGSQLLVQGNPSVPYISDQTAMYTYMNYNASLENMRRYAHVEQSKMIVDKSLKEQPDMDDTFSQFTCDQILDNEATTVGPRVLIMGSANSGKATLAKILSNFGVRCGHEPLLVDLDTSLNMISVPGCISAVSLNQPIDVEIGFNHCNYPQNENAKDMFNKIRNKILQENNNDNSNDNSNSNSNKNNNNSNNNENDNILLTGMDGCPSAMNDRKRAIWQMTNGKPLNNECNDLFKSSMIYFYGYNNPTEKPLLYKNVVNELALTIKRRFIRDLKCRASGMFIKCHHSLCNIRDKTSKQLLDHIIKRFKINVIFVIDKELVYNGLKSQFENVNLQCENIQTFQRMKQQQHYKQYMQGQAPPPPPAKSIDEIKKDLKLFKAQKFIAVIPAPKSAGVNERQSNDKYRIGQRSIENYFYGPFGLWESQNITIFNIGVIECSYIEGISGNDALLPTKGGANEQESKENDNVDNGGSNEDVTRQLAIRSVKSSRDAKNQLIALLMTDIFQIEKQNYLQEKSAKNDDPFHSQYDMQSYNNQDDSNIVSLHNKHIFASNVMGFCFASEESGVGTGSNAKVRLMLPYDDKLPTKVLLKGNITWVKK